MLEVRWRKRSACNPLENPKNFKTNIEATAWANPTSAAFRVWILFPPGAGTGMSSGCRKQCSQPAPTNTWHVRENRAVATKCMLCCNNALQIERSKGPAKRHRLLTKHLSIFELWPASYIVWAKVWAESAISTGTRTCRKGLASHEGTIDYAILEQATSPLSAFKVSSPTFTNTWPPSEVMLDPKFRRIINFEAMIYHPK